MFSDLTAAGVNVIIGKTADISTSLAFMTCVGMCVCAYILLVVYMKENIKDVNVEEL